MRTIPVIFLIATSILSSSVFASDYFPLVEGNQWSYTVSNGMQMMVEVTGFENVDGVRCAVVESNMGMQNSREYLALGSEGLKAYKSEAMGQEVQYEKPVLRIKLPFVQGQSWTASINQFGMDIIMAFESVGTEHIETPAGNFECIVVRSSMNMPGQPPMISDNYYADGKGLVHQVIRAGGQEMVASLTSVEVQASQQTDPVPDNTKKITPAQTRCPKCNAVVDAGAKFCPQCGALITRPAAPTVCPKCGTKLPPNAKFCPACGQKIEASAAGGQTTVQLALEKYQSPKGTLMLYKPKGWIIQEEDLEHGGYAVMVMEPQENAVVVFMTFPVGEHITDSVTLAGVCLTAFREEIPDLQAKDINSTVDKNRTIMEISLTDEGEKGLGHGYFFYTERVGTVYLLLARENLWQQLRPMLTNVASNIAYTPEGITVVAERGRELAARTEIAQGQQRVLNPAAMLQQAAQRSGPQVQLRQAALPDRSVSLQLPRGWTIEGRRFLFVAANNPQTRTHGFTCMTHSIVPTNMVVPGVINASYQPPPQALELVLRFSKIGTDVQVLGQCPADQVSPEVRQSVQSMRAQGFQVDARLMHVRFKNLSTGALSRGMFSVLCSTVSMSPVWQVTIGGSWAPDNEYDQWLPLYVKLEKSTHVNQQMVAREMQNNNFRQQQLNRNLQSSIAGANQAFDQYMDSLQDADRSRDYTSWMQSQTTLGQGTWVAENEGAEVYQTNSWGIEGPYGNIDDPAYNTTNFTGENPWGQNQLELVDTRDEYEKYVAD